MCNSETDIGEELLRTAQAVINPDRTLGIALRMTWGFFVSNLASAGTGQFASQRQPRSHSV